jgi:hypothetical protein
MEQRKWKEKLFQDKVEKDANKGEEMGMQPK